MKINYSDNVIELNKDESHIVYGSIIELGGVYKSRFAEHLSKFHGTDFSILEEKVYKSNQLPISGVSLVLETLYLLINEMADVDFIALYGSVVEEFNTTKEDVQKVYNNLEQCLKECENK